MKFHSGTKANASLNLIKNQTDLPKRHHNISKNIFTFYIKYQYLIDERKHINKKNIFEEVNTFLNTQII